MTMQSNDRMPQSKTSSDGNPNGFLPGSAEDILHRVATGQLGSVIGSKLVQESSQSIEPEKRSPEEILAGVLALPVPVRRDSRLTNIDLKKSSHARSGELPLINQGNGSNNQLPEVQTNFPPQGDIEAFFVPSQGNSSLEQKTTLTTEQKKEAKEILQWGLAVASERKKIRNSLWGNLRRSGSVDQNKE